MNISFKLIGGPYGDATSSYEVMFPSGITVFEFLDYIVNDYSINSGDNWGSFSAYSEEHGLDGGHFLHYNRGKAFYEGPWCNKEEGSKILNAIKNMPIKRITANGGWSNMGYRLYV